MASLRLEWMDATKLADNPHNWREHPKKQLDALGDVIEEVGWAGALLYNERTKRLIDGHARKKVSPNGKVPVLIGSWSEDQENTILATLDPLAAMAEANKDKLQSLTDSVKTESEAVNAMLEDLRRANKIALPVEEVPAQTDKIDELKAKWGTEEGQLWEVGTHRLLCGDGTKAEDVKRVLNGRVPFIMVTDPPYGVEYNGEWRDELEGGFGPHMHVGIGVANDDKVDWSEAFALSSADVAYIWHASWYIAEVQRSVIAAGFLPRSLVIWAKQHFAMSRGHYHWQHEPCWYAVKKGKNAYWNGDRTQSTIWEISSLNPAGRVENKEIHSTQKPVECMARPIRNHGGKADDVYDPFLGSGTTMVAAQQLGRRCYGIEIEPGYVAVALERMASMGLTPKLAGR